MHIICERKKEADVWTRKGSEELYKNEGMKSGSCVKKLVRAVVLGTEIIERSDD